MKFAIIRSLSVCALLCVACANEGGNEAEVPAGESQLSSVVVPDPTFTFATQQSVRLELASQDAQATKWVEVTDAEGRRLFEGPVRGARALELKLPRAAEQSLTVVTGQGAEAVSQVVSLENGRAAASL